MTPDDLATLSTADRAALRDAVSEVPRAELAALLSTDDGEKALRTAFERMPEYFTGEVVEPAATARWRVRREPATTLEYDLLLADGRCAVGPAEESATPAVAMTMDAVSFIEMAAGARSGVELLMQGRLHLEGDIELAVRLESLFGLGTGAA
jgi:predicted lipid carrier protein YhbT